MIIQHNIMAKKAYRGYSKGVSSMKGNLEKLSSGYKINRAGDDAAGLAISEKMRAQITGLETAAKNAKDGISLVQTAEGALAEVHDMLDRMIELAAQSANGTYDDATDRDQLQKEMEQLKAEVERIATSSNFNGMKLLDGTMDASTARGVEYLSTDAEGLEKMLVTKEWGTGEPDVANNIGVLESEDTLPVKGGFEINLDGTEVTIAEGETFTLDIGGVPIKPVVTPMETGRYVSSDLAKAFDGVEVPLKDADGKTCIFKAEAKGQVLKFTAKDGQDSFKLNTNAPVSWKMVDKVTADPPISGGTSKLAGAIATPVTGLGGTAATKGMYFRIYAPSPQTELEAGDQIKFRTGPGDNDFTTYTVVADNTPNIAADQIRVSETDSGGALNEFILDRAYCPGYETRQLIGGGFTDAATAGAIGKSGPPAELDYGIEFIPGPGNYTLGNEPQIVDKLNGINDRQGTEAVPGNKRAKLSAADFAAIQAAADKVTGVTSGKVTVKAGEANNTVALYVGDKKISADAAVGVAPVDVTIKDAEGNDLLTVSFEGGPLGISNVADIADGFEVGLTYNIDMGDGLDGDIEGELLPTAHVPSKDGDKEVYLSNADDAAIKAVADKTEGIASGDIVVKGCAGNRLALFVGDKKISAEAGFSRGPVTFQDEEGNDLLTVDFKNVEGRVFTTFKDGFETGMAYVAVKVDSDSVTRGTINSGIQNVVDNVKGEPGRVANTVIDFKPWTDGAKFTIGSTTYTVALGENSKFKNAANVIDLTDRLVDPLEDLEDIEIAAQRLSVAAKDNTIFTVGHDGKGHTTLQQRTEAKDSTDMTTKEKLISYLGVTVPHPDSMANVEVGQGLSFHVGENGDDSSKLKIDIGDMRTASLGIDGVSVETQENASAAIDKIKSAVNSVSDVRGTLGATQNRLDHSINNLSVVAENVQQSESTIRDTDVAEEMMEYTKNNILIQSSQSMLAQANQVPQGVLQLLG